MSCRHFVAVTSRGVRCVHCDRLDQVEAPPARRFDAKNEVEATRRAERELRDRAIASGQDRKVDDTAAEERRSKATPEPCGRFHAHPEEWDALVVLAHAAGRYHEDCGHDVEGAAAQCDSICEAWKAWRRANNPDDPPAPHPDCTRCNGTGRGRTGVLCPCPSDERRRRVPPTSQLETAFVAAYATFLRQSWGELTEKDADEQREQCIVMFEQVKALFREARAGRPEATPYRADMRLIGEALGLADSVSDIGHILGAIDEMRPTRSVTRAAHLLQVPQPAAVRLQEAQRKQAAARNAGSADGGEK